MGLFSFLKDVGEKLTGGGSDAAPDAQTLAKEVAKHGLDAKDLNVEVKDDTVQVSGETPSNAVREKIVLALGNVAGISKVDEAIKVENKEPDATFYEVKSGDTLWKIAEAHYGNGAKYNAIFEANTPMLKHPDKIYPGQMLRIPPLEA